MFTRFAQQLQRRPAAVVLAALSGCLYALGFCGFDQSYLAWFCFVPLFWAWASPQTGPRAAMGLAWLTGLFAHLGCYTWIIYMLRVFGYLPLPLAWLGYFLLCLAQSSMFALWGWLTHYLVRQRGVSIVWAAPAMLMLIEWKYPLLFPSFLSNALYQDLWAIQSLRLCGPLGLSGLLCLCSAVVYQLLACAAGRWIAPRSRRWKPAPAQFSIWGCACFVVLLALNAVYGFTEIDQITDTLAHTDKQLTVGLVQTNMGVYEKFENPVEGLRRHRNQSLELQEQGAQLILWPESSFVRGLDTALSNVKLPVMGPDLHTPLLFGGVRYERQPGAPDRLYNTAFLVQGDGQVLGRYDKNHLLMFGEMLPFGELLPWIYSLSPHTSHFTPGKEAGVVVFETWRLGVLICYEDILPSFIRRTMAHNPDVLINLTNDAWFGHTREPRIHMALATFGAVAAKRYLVRATNTGISSIIDPTGQVVAEAPSHTRANLLAQIAPMQEQTLYSRFGDWPAWPCLAGLLWHSRHFLRRRRKTASSKS